ncbi:Divergent Serine/Threonine protein kinase [Brazilian cedratvirus IHUMI]|uniref:Divergent Serine/Threonine protein kinase n=1 Tax=Brazilian cedratvirus IHUMI TaxID=2126980 RepID=A0A2R8FD01_9VIRU|nr:Divergent Serine/Threonine protein kinase [Brazilian cedratvirus IHUMI]
MYSFKVLLKGEEIEFVGETKSEALCKLDAYMEELLERGTHRNRTSYVKRRISHKLDYYLTEVQAYLGLADLDICPPLLSYGVLFEYKIISEHDSRTFYRSKPAPKLKEYTYYAYYIETELYGYSLGKEYNTVGKLCLDSRNLEQEFNFSPYPEFVREQIRDLVHSLHQRGVYHGDLHPDNILIKDGKVKIIDFELCEFVP